MTDKFVIFSNSINKLTPQVLKFSPVAAPLAASSVVCGAASLRTGAKSPNGDKISVGSLVRLELIDSHTVRVTCRTVYPAASQALMDCIKRLLA